MLVLSLPLLLVLWFFGLSLMAIQGMEDLQLVFVLSTVRVVMGLFVQVPVLAVASQALNPGVVEAAAAQAVMELASQTRLSINREVL